MKAASNSNALKSVEQAYDEVNYESNPFSQSHPSHLQALARLFGLNAPDFKKARILELGCSSGGNIIPIAAYYPNTKCVGVDLSSKQVERGQKIIDGLGLKNMTLKAMSITDITKKEFGEFDYIISHGVYSWVPDMVQEAMLKVCGELLSPKGVAYISYNTLPGWNMVRSFREMMLFHTRGITDPAKKLEQACAFVKYVTDLNKDSNSPYIQALQQEMNMLDGKDAYYFLHDHLEINNHPCYLYEFMERAEKHGLQYLSDTHPHATYIGALVSPEVVRKLGEVNNLVAQEQYVDFLINRRFRSTLLCKRENILQRAVSSASLGDLAVLSTVKSSIASNVLTKQNLSKAEFRLGSGATCNKNNKNLAMLLFHLVKQGSEPIKVESLYKEVLKSLKVEKGQEQAILLELGAHMLNLVFYGGVELLAEEVTLGTKKVSPKPKIFEIAKQQALNSNIGTNALHKPVAMNSIIVKLLVGLLDGKHDKKQIFAKLSKAVEDNKLQLKTNDQVVETVEDREKLLAEMLDQALQYFAANGLLEK
jgi:methyltransferase-like protein/cyclopropane fatty-acyl-phospholipid synthase-like methyltransferase